MGNPIAWIRTTNSLLGHIAPGVSAAMAERVFTSPHRHTPPDREAPAEARGRRVELGAGRSALRFGQAGQPTILAMHGWEGRATQWGPLALAAERAGFGVVAVDAPGHGHSTGQTSHPGAFAEAMLAADRRYGPFAAVVGHSMGGAAATLALHRGLRAERVVMIASPSAMIAVLRRFAAHIRLSAVAEQRFLDRVEQVVGLAPEEFDVASLTLRQPTLVIHSRDDREVPFGEAEAIVGAWPAARLLEMEGLGHRRILSDSRVIEAAVQFLATQ